MSRTACAILAALLLAGCSSPAAAPEPDRLEVDEQATLPARGRTASSHEVNLELGANATFRFGWNATADLSFNIHSHGADHDVVMHLRHFGTGRAGEFRAPAAGGYSLMWENFSPQAVQLRYTLEGEGRVQA